MKEQLNIITKEQLCAIFDEEDRTKQHIIEWHGEQEIDGLLYSVWQHRDGRLLATREVRTVHMGFNSNEPGKVEKFIEIVEREGCCKATWGVTGRTMHSILGHQLAKELPQYDWVIGGNYECKATKK